jgi:hypothetical protein
MLVVENPCACGKFTFVIRRVSPGIGFVTLLDKTTRYYNSLSGGVDIRSLYKASVRVQRKHGIGSFFRGLFRYVKPLFFSGTQGIGKEALQTASNILTDIISNRRYCQVVFWRSEG